jgi:hypothetical protein
VAGDEWRVASGKIGRKNGDTLPTPMFFGSVDSGRVKGKNRGSVDSSRLETVYNECDTKVPRFLGSVDSKAIYTAHKSPIINTSEKFG